MMGRPFSVLRAVLVIIGPGGRRVTAEGRVGGKAEFWRGKGERRERKGREGRERGEGERARRKK
jgi:hypothetical protein